MAPEPPEGRPPQPTPPVPGPSAPGQTDETFDRVVQLVADTMARQHGYESMEQAEAVTRAIGLVFARQTRWGAFGLSLVTTAVLVLFLDPAYQARSALGTYVGTMALACLLLFVIFWLTLGGLNARDPFAPVRPIQLWMRRVGMRLVVPGAIAVVALIGYHAVTGSFFSVRAIGGT